MAEPIDDLLAAYAADHDPSVQERIIVTHLELADRLALRYRNAGASLEDLRQTARTGLVAAVDRYQADRSRRAVSLDAPPGEPGTVALSEFIPAPEPRHNLEDLILLPS